MSAPFQQEDEIKKDKPEHYEGSLDDLPSDANPLERILAGHGHDMTAEDRMTALRIAQDIDPGPPIASWRMLCFTGYAMVTCMCSGDNGEFGISLQVSIRC
jgi:hypothetical protein